MKQKVFIYTESGRIPDYATIGSSGVDFTSIEDDCVLKPLERKLFKTGVYINLPEGCEMQIRPKSGLAYKFGITVLNTPGTIDNDYKGEIKILLVNLSNDPFTVKKDSEIAQGVLASFIQGDFEPVYDLKALGETERGTGGFGHTYLK